MLFYMNMIETVDKILVLILFLQFYQMFKLALL